MAFLSCVASSSRAGVSMNRYARAAHLTRHLHRLGHPRPRLYRHQSTSAASSSSNASSVSGDADDPLRPNIPLSDLQLPLIPLAPPIPQIASSEAITRPVLHRLHRLSALNPPPEDSEEEKQLMEELNGLVGLMDLVKAVELPKDLDMAELLSEGRGQIIVDGSHLDKSDRGEDRAAKVAREAKEAERGRELLAYATKTTGEYYSSKSNRKASA